MAFPNPPDFTVAADGAAWWRVLVHPADGGATQFYRCATDGYSFVRALQTALATDLQTPLVAWDGTAVGGPGMTIDGKWGPMTSQGLWVAARVRSAPQALLDIVRLDAGNRTVSWGSLKAAVWYLARMTQAIYGQPDLPAIDVPSNAVTPRWKVAAPPPPSGGISTACVLTDAAGAPLAPPGSPIPVVNETVPVTPAPTPGDPYLLPAPPPALPARAIELAAAAVVVAGVLALVAWSRGRSTARRRA